MNSADSTVSESNMAQSRALYVIAVACFPVLITGVLTLLVFLSGAVVREDGMGHKSEYAHIQFPVPGKLVGDRFKLKGFVDAVPPGEVAYIVEKVDRRYWPKKRLGTSPVEIANEHKTSPGQGYKYDIEVISVNADGDAQLKTWFDTGNQTGKYPGIEHIVGVQVLAKVRVVRK